MAPRSGRLPGFLPLDGDDFKSMFGGPGWCERRSFCADRFRGITPYRACRCGPCFQHPFAPGRCDVYFAPRGGYRYPWDGIPGIIDHRRHKVNQPPRPYEAGGLGFLEGIAENAAAYQP